jgi:hypothetical protein
MVGVMDPRLSEHFPPEPEPAPAPVDSGPASQHQLHGKIALGWYSELRVTSQVAKRGDRPQPPRICVRLWYYNHQTRSWWPHRGSPGISVPAKDARAFLAAVTAAVAQLEQDGGGGT